MKTAVINASEIKRKWYVVDASGKHLGRLASNIALKLTGKSKPAFSPNQDHGDNIIVINADNVRLTGTKAETKEYFRHSTYPGGGKTRSFREQMELDSTQVIRHAVRGMIPKTKLGRAVIRKLHVYKGDNHPHSAQKPETLEV